MLKMALCWVSQVTTVYWFVSTLRTAVRFLGYFLLVSRWKCTYLVPARYTSTLLIGVINDKQNSQGKQVSLLIHACMYVHIALRMRIFISAIEMQLLCEQHRMPTAVVRNRKAGPGGIAYLRMGTRQILHYCCTYYQGMQLSTAVERVPGTTNPEFLSCSRDKPVFLITASFLDNTCGCVNRCSITSLLLGHSEPAYPRVPSQPIRIRKSWSMLGFLFLNGCASCGTLNLKVLSDSGVCDEHHRKTSIATLLQ